MYTLTNAEQSVLSKGLSFIPTPKSTDLPDVRKGIIKFRAQIANIYGAEYKQSLNEAMSQPDVSHESATGSRNGSPNPAVVQYDPSKTIRKFKHKIEPTTSRSTENETLNQTLDAIESKLVQISETITLRNTDNITRAERKAISSLKNNTQIVINRADKGSTIVVLNRDDYIEDGLKHLDNPTVYRKLKSDITGEVYQLIMRFLKTLKWQGWIPRSFVDFCTPPQNYRTSQLYFLKKIHKNPMGIRPIVSSVNAVTENISNFLDGWLNPLVSRLPSYLKDSKEFIELITTQQVPSDAILVSIDVSSLYTNIPHEDGIQACIKAIKECSDPDPLQPPLKILVEMLNIVLKNNVIEFNNEFFLQLQGTAMGTKMAPAYANLFMGSLEPTLIGMGGDNILLWRRFIDDIFLIWLGTADQLTRYLGDINQVHPTIKFTHEQSTQQLTFLDVTIYKGPNFGVTNTLDVKTHIKPTNKQLYVHSTSYHPKSVKKAIPRGEAVRYLRSNTQEQTYMSILKQLKQKLIERGYNSKSIDSILREYPFTSRNTFMSNSDKDKDKAPIVLPIKYGPLCKEARDILTSNWPSLNQDNFLKQIFTDTPIVAPKRNQTLANILVRSKVIGNEPNRPMTNSRPPRGNPRPIVNTDVAKLFPNRLPTKHCGRQSCTVCPRLLRTNSIHVRHLSYNVRIPDHMPPLTCTTKNVVYIIKCKKHHKAYVGQTTNMVRVRIGKHLAQTKSFRRGNRTNMGHHFNDPNCSIANLVWAPIDIIPHKNTKREAEIELQKLETHWIRKLCSMQPWGMNYIETDTEVRTIGPMTG